MTTITIVDSLWRHNDICSYANMRSQGQASCLLTLEFKCHLRYCSSQEVVMSLSHSAVLHYTLFQAMTLVSCDTKPLPETLLISHQWGSQKSNFTMYTLGPILYDEFENDISKITAIPPRNKELNSPWKIRKCSVNNRKVWNLTPLYMLDKHKYLFAFSFIIPCMEMVHKVEIFPHGSEGPTIKSLI